jgi:hypothetical protein
VVHAGIVVPWTHGQTDSVDPRMGKDMSRRKPEDIGKGPKGKKHSLARASERTIKKLLKAEKKPASMGEKSRG